MADIEHWNQECEHSLVCAMEAVVKWWGNYNGLLETAKVYRVFQALHGHCDPGGDGIAGKILQMRMECNDISLMLRNGFRFDCFTNKVVGTPEAWTVWESVCI